MKYILILIALVSLGCGSIIRGTTQKIPVSSTPEGAEVLIKYRDIEENKGKTPVILELKRKIKEYKLTLIKDGYYPYNTTLVRKTSAASAVGNFAIDFGLISHLVIDRNTGGAYELVPESIDVELQKK